MNKEFEPELDGLLNKYNQNLRRRKEQKEAIAQEQATFLKEFERVKEDTIMPVMQKMKDKLAQYNHKCVILEDKESIDHLGKTTDAKIEMRIVPAGEERRSVLGMDVTHVSFIAKKHSKKLLAHTYIAMVSGSGHGGSAGEIDLNELTSEMVERLITDVLKGMFDSKWTNIQLQ